MGLYSFFFLRLTAPALDWLVTSESEILHNELESILITLPFLSFFPLDGLYFIIMALTVSDVKLTDYLVCVVH